MAITNNQIVMDALFELIRNGAVAPDEEIHTFARWKAMGYSVKKGEHAVVKVPVWKMGTRKDEDGERKETGRMFMQTSAFFSTRQVEKMPEKAGA